MSDIYHYIDILKNNDKNNITNLLSSGLNMILHNLNIIDILLMTDETTIQNVYKNIDKELLIKFFYIPETNYNPFFNLISLGFFKNIILLINLLSEDLEKNLITNILQYQDKFNLEFWMVKFINSCNYIELYIYDFFKRYATHIVSTNNNTYNFWFNYNFLIKLSYYDYADLERMGYFDLLKNEYKYTLTYPTEINSLIEIIHIYYTKNIKLLNLIEKLIQIYPAILDTYNKYGVTVLGNAFYTQNIDVDAKDKLIKLIIKYKNNYNIIYNHHRSDFDTLLKNASYEILDLIDLDKINIDYTYQDIYRSSYGHIIFNLPGNYPEKFKIKILENCDLATLNIYRQSIIHLLFKNDDYKKYLKILLNNKDITYSLFTKDNFNFTPIDYLNKNDKKYIFNDLVKLLLNNNKKFIKYCNKVSEDKILYCLKKNIDTILPDFYKLNDYKLFKIHKSDKIYTFNSSYNSNVFFTIMLLEEYTNLGCYYILDRFNLNYIVNIDNYKTTSKYQSYLNIINEFVSCIRFNLYGLEIIWFDKNLNYIPNDIFTKFDKLYINKNITRFYIYIKILYENSSSTHLNILWFDYTNKYVIRFEPYGSVFFANNDIDTTFENYLKKYKSNFKYYKPSDYLNITGFQILGEENFNEFVNEPRGRCAPWCHWFIETMLSYESDKVDSTTKLKKIFRTLLLKLVYENNPIMYIRNYSYNIQQRLIKFFIKYGISSENSYKICNIDTKYNNDDAICDKLLTFVLTRLNKKLD